MSSSSGLPISPGFHPAGTHLVVLGRAPTLRPGPAHPRGRSRNCCLQGSSWPRQGWLKARGQLVLSGTGGRCCGGVKRLGGEGQGAGSRWASAPTISSKPQLWGPQIGGGGSFGLEVSLISPWPLRETMIVTPSLVRQGVSPGGGGSSAPPPLGHIGGGVESAPSQGFYMGGPKGVWS